MINLLHGKGTIVNLVAVLRAIGELERVTSLVQAVLPSPLQVIKMAGSQRMRATGARPVRTENKDGSRVVSAPTDKAKKYVPW